MKQLSYFLARLRTGISSDLFFWGVVGLLVVQAAWISLTAHYPMAFDEDFHVGILRIYASHLSPFLAGQPANADMYGAVARDPSYLYHYLISFIYRFISLFTSNATIQILLLRFLNIAMFAGGLVLFRRLFLRLRAPHAAINIGLLLFVLIPVVPLIAAQINYDNLFIPMVAFTLLLAVLLLIEFKKEHTVNPTKMLVLLASLLLASLVKYAFLPVFLVIGLYMGGVLLQSLIAERPGFHMFWDNCRKLMTGWRFWLALGAVVLSLGLFSQRYLVNVVRYHTPIPDCGKILTVKQCSAYGPWIRDYNFSINKGSSESHGPVAFTDYWLRGMWLRLYFAVDGPTNDYQTRGPLPVPAISGIIIAVLSLAALVMGLPKLLKRYDRYGILLVLSTSTVYVITLWLTEYKAFARTGQPVAINGRYLLPFIPIILVLSIMAGCQLFRRYPRLGSLVVVCAVVSQLAGGGVLTYILRSNDQWYWHNPAARAANNGVQRVLGPVTPGYYTPTQFLQ